MLEETLSGTMLGTSYVSMCFTASPNDPRGSHSFVSNSATPWTGARQAPLSMGFSRHECWSKLPCPPPEGLPHPGIEPTSLMSPALQEGSLSLAPPGKPTEHLLAPSGQAEDAELFSFISSLISLG